MGKVTLGTVAIGAIGGLIWWVTRPKELPAASTAKGIAEGGMSGGLQQPPR